MLKDEPRAENAGDAAGLTTKLALPINTEKEYSAVLNVDQISMAHFQPEGRTDARALAGLKRLVQENNNKILQEVHVVHRLPEHIYSLADGHRRVTVARQLGIKFIRARIHTEGTPEELWTELNKETRKITPAEWLASFLASKQEVKPPRTVANHIKVALKVFGSEREVDKWLVSRQLSPYVSVVASDLWERMTFYKSLHPVPDVKDIAIWLIEHKMQHAVRAFVQAPNSKESITTRLRRMKKAITSNMPLVTIQLRPTKEERNRRTTS